MRILKKWNHVKVERREQLKSWTYALPRRTKWITGTTMLIIGTSFVPIRVFAAGSLETSASQVKVGTLPLLAALGIGIAVAVGAVIAFLQMTARGKEIDAMASEDNETIYEDTTTDEWDDE